MSEFAVAPLVSATRNHVAGHRPMLDPLSDETPCAPSLQTAVPT